MPRSFLWSENGMIPFFLYHPLSERYWWGFPSGSVVKASPSRGGRGAGPIRIRGVRIPHANRTQTTEVMW